MEQFLPVLISLSSVPPNTVINVNININIDVTIVVCPICPPLTTVVYKAIYIPAPTHFYSFGNWYYCNTVGWYNILCPYTVHPGRTTTIASCPYITYTHAAYTTQTYTYNSPATTTVYTYPTSIMCQLRRHIRQLLQLQDLQLFKLTLRLLSHRSILEVKLNM